MKKVSITPNSNFHFEGEKSILDSGNAEFKRYRYAWLNNPREFKVGEFPLHLDIELTNICNLRCAYCASTHNKWGSDAKGKMSFDLFRCIIDEGARNGLYSIKFSLRGESLLHEELPKMIRYAKSKGIIDMYFNTNGVLLDTAKGIELIEAGLNRISVSCDGWDKESFEKNRTGASFEKVYNNILELRSSREKLNKDYPKIRIQAVGFGDVRQNWRKYLKLWKPLAEEVGYLDARDEGAGASHGGKKADWACPFLWQRMVILWDGTILPCLLHGVDDSSQMEMGNVIDTSIKEQWLSEKMENFRTHHKKGCSHEIEACDKCSYRALEIGKLVSRSSEKLSIK